MTAKRILLADLAGEARDLEGVLERAGWEVQLATNLSIAHAAAKLGTFQVGLLLFPAHADIAAQDIEVLTGSTPMHWIAVLPALRLQDPAWAKLVLEQFYDYHTSPADTDRLLVILGHALGRVTLKHNLNRTQEWLGRYQMVGKSRPMLDLYAKLDRVTRVDAPVLITGESGTGKELVARAIHEHSRRASGPFVPVNCGGLPESLVHSELFGHERGSFTGAHQRKIGSIEAASGGTIFLDEIGDLPLELQSNLLRFLQEKMIVRVGSTQRIPMDVRVIAATHVDLDKAVREGRFREDLFYRLTVLHLPVPPLRERGGDIELLVEALFKEFANQKNIVVQGFGSEAMRAMATYAWPGNVRELMNRVQHAMIMSEHRLITPADLGLSSPSVPKHVITLSRARAAAESDVIRTTLRSNANNVSRAARALGVSRVTLYRLMDKFGIDRSQEG
jgi:DNA-binding NtrC family response regulator